MPKTKSFRDAEIYKGPRDKKIRGRRDPQESLEMKYFRDEMIFRKAWDEKL